MNDVLERLEILEKRIKELESLLRPSQQMFGRSYSLVGNTDSDFLIKTKGQIKIQWGSKFIDLIKDGKINVDTSFIFSVKDRDRIGAKEGIYVLEDGESIFLKTKESLISLGESGNTYVSFLSKLKTSADDKYMAMRNIGFLYPTIESIDSDSLLNGIIYIESEKKLYVISNGKLSEFTINFPNPFNLLFIILKNDLDKGAILIKGEGINNSLAFDSFYIFTEKDITYMQSVGSINVQVGDNEIITVSYDSVQINGSVESSRFLSPIASDTQGFMLYTDKYGSHLIVDDITVRNPKESTSVDIYPTYWSSKSNIIIDEKENEDDNTFTLTFKYDNQYKINDYLYLHGLLKTEDSIKLVTIPVRVEEVDEDYINRIKVLVLEDLTEGPIPNTFIGYTSFLISSTEKLLLIRYSETNIDLLECSNIQDERNLNSINTRVGVLTDLGLTEKINGTLKRNISGQGIFSKNSYFLNAGYTSEYNLTEKDSSTKFASTEWTRNLLSKTIPVGVILAYHGSIIPDGWAICNGTNGTPNLIGKFIVANSFEGDGDEIEITPLDAQVGEDPLRVKISPTYYSLIFIMKIK